MFPKQRVLTRCQEEGGGAKTRSEWSLRGRSEHSRKEDAVSLGRNTYPLVSWLIVVMRTSGVSWLWGSELINLVVMAKVHGKGAPALGKGS